MGRAWKLAIDFGTSFTTAATSVDGEISTLEIANSRYLPSTVGLDAEGGWLTGRQALQFAQHSPESVVRLPKRALAAGTQVRLGGRTVGTVELVAAVLDRVRAEALPYHGGRQPEELVLTHPARWGDGELESLTKAAFAAGLPEPSFVSEPVAAAAHYVLGCPVLACAEADRVELEAGDCLAVFDLGGGTLDLAVVRRTHDGFELVGAPGGDGALGGEDLDERLLELLADWAQELRPQTWDRLWAGTGPEERRAWSLLRREVTEAKELLSGALQVDLAVPGYEQAFRVSRRTYETAIEPDLRRAVALLEDTVSRAGLSPFQLGALVLAGSASRTPKVSDLIALEFGTLPSTTPDPKCVVSHGALLATGPRAPSPEAAPPKYDPDNSDWLDGR